MALSVNWCCLSLAPADSFDLVNPIASPNSDIMKKINFKTGMLVLLSALFTEFVFGQTGVLPVSRPIRDENAASLTAPINEKKGAGIITNAKVTRSFQRNFQSAKNISWFENKEGYSASFDFEGRMALAFFNKSGRLYCTIYYGSEKDLPEGERELIHSTYQDYEITSTQEIDYNGAHAWLVTVQNCKNIKKVRIQEGDLHVLEHLNRNN
jgi:hypothetical protein